MNKTQVRDIMIQMEKEPPGASIVLPLVTKVERDTARILFHRYANRIADTEYPLYKYCFNFRSVSIARDGVPGFAIERVALSSHQMAVFVKDGLGNNDVKIITDPTLESLVDRQTDIEFAKFMKKFPYDEELIGNPSDDIKLRFKQGGLSQQEKQVHVKVIDWTEEKKHEIKDGIKKELWDGTMFLNFAHVDHLKHYISFREGDER